MTIDPVTTIGAVSLTVTDLERARDFYERVVGLGTVDRHGDALRLAAAADGPPLIELTGRSDAPRRPRGTTGLFHLAILLPTRRDLAEALARIAAARAPLGGASDHLVSEALYVSDPDGNGIEIYRDRPRAEWPTADGEVQMATLPLDLDDLGAELGGGPAEPAAAPPETRIGHVHLNVADLAEAEAFYRGVLGFEVTVRSYPGALFLSAGGYHHHIGLNTWAGPGASPPPPGSTGLRYFEVVLPSREELDRVAERALAASSDAERGEDGVLVFDPSRNGVRLTSRA